jgi:Protein of unknown function (DUF742)
MRARADEVDPRLVPVYAVTQGRTQVAGPNLPWEAMVTTTSAGLASLPRLHFEQARIVDLCQWPVSVAEIAADLEVPVGVARVLVSDLSTDGLVGVDLPAVLDDGRPAVEVLERLLAGLQQGA